MSEVSTVENTVAAPKGDALDQAVAEEVTRVLGLSFEERTEYLQRTALDVAGAAVALPESVSVVESMASVRVRVIMAEQAGQSATYQAALNYAVAATSGWFGYANQGDYITRGLGYSKGYGTTLKDLATAAVVVGIADRSPEWRHIVQSSPTRSALKQALAAAKPKADGTLPKAVVAKAAKAVHTATEANPSGKAANDKSGRRGRRDAPSSDAALAACNKALDVVRGNFKHLTEEARKGLVGHLEALVVHVETGIAPAAPEEEPDRNNRNARTGQAQAK